jgi:Zn-finger nucleic acid-binding protein
MSDRQGVEIDYCPQCRGVWLDRGELDKIIERSSPQELSPAPQPHYIAQPTQHANGHAPGDGHWNSNGHKPYRKKSFLEQLFD